MAEENAAKDAGGGEKKSGSKPIIMYALAVINMVFMGAVGFMVQKHMKNLESQPKIDDVIKGEHETQKEEAHKEEEFVGNMIPLETFLVNLSGSRGQKLLKLNMELEVEGEKVQEEIDKRKPHLRDTIITILSSKTYAQISSAEGKEYLRGEIRDTMNSILTKGKVKRVLFTEFIFN